MQMAFTADVLWLAAFCEDMASHVSADWGEVSHQTF
jgi:hypothetical protein